MGLTVGGRVHDVGGSGDDATQKVGGGPLSLELRPPKKIVESCNGQGQKHQATPSWPK